MNLVWARVCRHLLVIGLIVEYMTVYLCVFWMLSQDKCTDTNLTQKTYVFYRLVKPTSTLNLCFLASCTPNISLSVCSRTSSSERCLLCQHEVQALCRYHCLMSIIAQQINSLSLQHNYIFTFLVAVLAVQVWACVLVLVSLCLLLHCTQLHSYQLMLPKPSALSRLMNQRQVPEGKHVHCHMSLSWMAAFSMHHMP